MTRDAFLKQVGATGFPPIFDTSLKSTWDTYEKTATVDRVAAVLGFLHLVRESGLSKKCSIKEKPEVLYKEFCETYFVDETKRIARLLVSYRLLDVLRLFKSKFSISQAVRGDTCIFRFDLVFEPKRKEPLDSALTKLQGLLYTGSLPHQLQESWKKLPVKSKAAHKSSLPAYNQILNTTSSLGFYALSLKLPSTIHAKRAAKDLLVIRITANVAVPTITWLSPRKHEELLKQLLSKAFLKLKG